MTPATRKRSAGASIERAVEPVLAALRLHASDEFKQQLQPRYGIVAPMAFGTPMSKVKLVARQVGQDHALAQELWQTGWYEARLLTSFVDRPEEVTSQQMDRWRADFDNWAVVDTLCFNLFDRTADPLASVRAWAKLEDEFGRRAAFALLASTALHRKDLDDESFRLLIPLIEDAAGDKRNFVKKGVSWALKALRSRKSVEVRAEAAELARKLASSDRPTERWIGKDALKVMDRS